MHATEPVTFIRFERGTLVIDDRVEGVPGVLWDPRSRTWRASAHRLSALRKELGARGSRVVDPGCSWRIAIEDAARLELREYQKQALAAWHGLERRGIVVLPTGAGKTRLAIAAILETGLPSVVLCPTRALAATWVAELGRWLGAPIGLVGDGERRIERVTVMTFESAYRCMDALGDRFGLLVVDEVHHFGTGIRMEALEASPAVARLGLTATAPRIDSAQMRRLEAIVGPVVFEMAFGDLVGRHLAEVSLQRISVRLDPNERRLYDDGVREFRELARTFHRTYPGADYVSLMQTLSKSAEGRRAIALHAKALEVASFPRAKRALVQSILEQHRSDKTLVFTAFAENAFDVARDNLVPVIAAETSSAERRDVLEGFSSGRFRAIASARVLNEGIDVPDARVAIIVAGTLGTREHVQRIGRVLRPSAGKRALVYELVTKDTTDEKRARKRGRHAAGTVGRAPRI